MILLKGFIALFINLFSVFICASEETQVSCVFNESCVLPCSFQSGSEPVIHWTKTPGDVPVHIYFRDQNQVQHQNQDFKDRTSLFVDQISRGNASLLLREVKVQDEGTYECYTSTVNGDKTSFINHRVHAPVKAVKLEPVGDELKCSSEDIYPKPAVTWSSSNKTEPNTSVSVSEKGLYSIFSSVPLSHKPPEEHSCNISTDHSWSSATYSLLFHKSISENKVTVPCSASNASIKSIVWKFNQTQTILTQTGTNRVYNESWRQFVEDVSESSLTLKNLDSGHQGVYSCVLSSDRETLISSTHLKTQPETESDRKRLYIWLGVTVPLVVLVLIGCCCCCWKRQQCSQKSQPSKDKSENRGATGECNISNQEDKLLTSTNIHPQEEQLPNGVVDQNTAAAAVSKEISIKE